MDAKSRRENVGVERKNCWRLMEMERGGRERVQSLSLSDPALCLSVWHEACRK